MDYRDWGSGELVRRAPRPEDAPDDGSGSIGGAAYLASGRTRAARRQPAADSAQRYVPDWARGAQSSGGGGRHRHEDDEEPVPRPAGHRAGRQRTETTGGWRRSFGAGYPASGPSDREPVSGGWAVDRPAGWPDAVDPEPASGGWALGSYPEERPARHSAATGRRRARDDGSGGLHRSVTSGDDVPNAAPVTGGGRWGGASRGSRWDRVAEPDEWEHSPAVDPWDRSPAVDPWARPDDTSVGAWRWDGGADSGGADTGQWDRLADQTREWSRAADPVPAEPPETYRRYGRRETFWSGTRLAGDDPRWMDTPTAAPRSPAVDYPPAGTRPGTAPGRRTEHRGGPARRGAVPAARRGGTGTQRSSTVANRAAIRRLERDLAEGERGGIGAALLCTAAWYAAPLLVLFGWLLTLDGRVPAGCVTDVTGGGCESPRAHAVASLINGAPQFGAALTASLLVAMVLRRAGGTWRATTVGLISAVVGGGLSTVLFSALSDRPLG